jgi:hypothetical protein
MSSPATPPTERSADSPSSRGYETRDVDPKVILGLVGGIVIVVAGSMVGLRMLMNGHSAVATRNRSPRPLRVDQTPPEPRLQNTPARDYEAFAAEQEKQLNSYGWIDREKEVVRIPVSRAMELALERGLPKPAARPSESERANSNPDAKSE